MAECSKPVLKMDPNPFAFTAKAFRIIALLATRQWTDVFHTICIVAAFAGGGYFLV